MSSIRRGKNSSVKSSVKESRPGHDVLLLNVLFDTQVDRVAKDTGYEHQ